MHEKHWKWIYGIWMGKSQVFKLDSSLSQCKLAPHECNFFQNIALCPFLGATDTHILDFWWCLLWVSNPEWADLFIFGRDIHVTCSLRFTSGATPADLFHVPVSQHCWSMKLGSITTLLPHSVRSGRCSAESLLVYLQVMNGEYKEPSTHSSEGAMQVEFLESISWKLQYKRDMHFNSGLTSNSLIASYQLYFYCVYIDSNVILTCCLE